MPGAAPQDLETFIRSSTEILVFWNVVPELDQNGIIINYEVQLEPLGFPADIFVDLLNATDLQERATDLEEFVNYNISVRAYTSLGPGPYSDPVTERTLEDGNVLITLFIFDIMLTPLILLYNPQYQPHLLRMSKPQLSPPLRSW